MGADESKLAVPSIYKGQNEFVKDSDVVKGGPTFIRGRVYYLDIINGVFRDNKDKAVQDAKVSYNGATYSSGVLNVKTVGSYATILTSYTNQDLTAIVPAGEWLEFMIRFKLNSTSEGALWASPYTFDASGSSEIIGFRGLMGITSRYIDDTNVYFPYTLPYGSQSVSTQYLNTRVSVGKTYIFRYMHNPHDNVKDIAIFEDVAANTVELKEVERIPAIGNGWQYGNIGKIRWNTGSGYTYTNSNIFDLYEYNIYSTTYTP